MEAFLSHLEVERLVAMDLQGEVALPIPHQLPQPEPGGTSEILGEERGKQGPLLLDLSPRFAMLQEAILPHPNLSSI